MIAHQAVSNKGDHSGLSTVELTVFLAVAYLNDGAGSIVLVLQGLGIRPGVHCKKACHKLDHNRLCHTRRKNTEHFKKRDIRNWTKGYTDTLEALKGPHYASGAFWSDSYVVQILNAVFSNSVLFMYLQSKHNISKSIWNK